MHRIHGSVSVGLRTGSTYQHGDATSLDLCASDNRTKLADAGCLKIRRAVRQRESQPSQLDVPFGSEGWSIAQRMRHIDPRQTSVYFASLVQGSDRPQSVNQMNDLCRFVEPVFSFHAAIAHSQLAKWVARTVRAASDHQGYLRDCGVCTSAAGVQL